MRNGDWNIWGKLLGTGLRPDSWGAVTMDLLQIQKIEDDETRVQKIYEVLLGISNHLLFMGEA